MRKKTSETIGKTKPAVAKSRARKTKPIKVLFATGEALPYVKTGGLADVAGALPVELARLGVEPVIFLPEYRGIRERFNLEPTGIKVWVPILEYENTVLKEGEVFTTERNGVRAFFLKNDEFYDREYLYSTPQGDYKDNAVRFIFYARGLMEFIKAGGFSPDVIHCHDWQAGLAPVYIKTLYKDEPGIKGIKTLLTIHNLAYQGIFWAFDIKQIGLDWSYFTPDLLEFYGQVNFLKGGLVYADLINTVSKKYAEEIQTPEFGCKLEGVLTARRQDLFGIVNGIDYSVWNPETDEHIPAKFSAKDLSGKKVCKAELKKELGLEHGDAPLIGIISRLADQKGLDIVAESLDEILGMGYQVVILGTGQDKYHNLFKSLAEPCKGKASFRIEFNDPLAHRIEAGADLFLMPSRYEPCGLNQLISLKYGTVPVVRATGGLDDTIENFDPATGKGTGFKFVDATKEAMMTALKSALEIYRQPKLWEKLVKNGMKKDFSWKSSAKEYVKLYKKLLGK